MARTACRCFRARIQAVLEKKYKGVEYRLGYLPFGGYCDIPQVDATNSTPKAADGTVLERAKPIDRIITAVAGPLFNLLSGMLIACIVWICGMPQDTPKMREIFSIFFYPIRRYGLIAKSIFFLRHYY